MNDLKPLELPAIASGGELQTSALDPDEVLEASPARSSVHVVYTDRALGGDRHQRELEHGRTITEIVDEIGMGERSGDELRVVVGDTPIDRKWWANVKPRAGSLVTVRRVPGAAIAVLLTTIGAYLGAAVAGTVGLAGAWIGSGIIAFGGAGLGGIAASALGLTGIAAGLVGTVVNLGLTIGLQLALRSIVGTPKQGGSSGQSLGRATSPTLSGTRNRVALNGPCQSVFGLHKVYPPFAAAPYTDTIGDRPFVRMLFDVSYGPCDITDVRVGRTPILQIPGAQFEVREGLDGDLPPTLYPTATVQEFLQIPFQPAEAFGPSRFSDIAQRTTSQDVEIIGVDLDFPQGLYRMTRTGSKHDYLFLVKLQFANFETPDVWINACDTPGFGPFLGWGNVVPFPGPDGGMWLLFKAQTTKPFTRGFQWPVPKGQYHVRIQRYDNAIRDNLQGGAETSQCPSVFVWIALRGHKTGPAVTLPGRALLAVLLPLDDTTQGVADLVSCVVQRKLPTWNDGTGWGPPIVTRSPVWAMLEVLRGRANPLPVPDDKLDLVLFAQLAVFLDLEGRTFDHVVDYETTVGELCQDIAASCRCSFFDDGEKYTVASDRPKNVPIGFFSPRNSWGFSLHHVVGNTPHALRMRFTDAEDEYRADAELLVYDDGYTEENATRIDRVDTVGLTNKDLVYKDGRYYLAASRARPAVYRLTAFVEAVQCTKGDLVLCSHFVPKWPFQTGFVKTVEVDGGGNATAIVCDDTFSMAADGHYVVRVRSQVGSATRQRTWEVVTEAGDTQRLVFTTPVLAAFVPMIGDLAFFGPRGLETVRLLVKGVRYNRDLQAPSVELELTDYAPAIFDADKGPIPEFDPQIVQTLPPAVVVPESPMIRSVISDETVMLRTLSGALIPQIAIFWGRKPGDRTLVEYVLVQWKSSDGGEDWQQLPPVEAGSSRVFIPGVSVGKLYDLRLKLAMRAGSSSEWSTVTGHLVTGATNPPPDVTDLRLDADRKRIRWSMPFSPIDLAGYRVRSHIGDVRTWDNATPAHEGILGVSVFDVSDYVGLRTLLVKAVDEGGNESTNAAVLVDQLGDALIGNVVETQDEAAGGFTGTKTQCTVVSGDLEADAEPTQFWHGAPAEEIPEDANPFWTAADSATFWTAAYLSMAYDFAISPAVANTPGALTIAVDGTWSSITITWAPDPPIWGASDGATFWDPSDAGLFWEETQGSFVPFPGRVEAFDRTHFVHVALAGGAVQGVITDLVATIDVPDVIERLNDIAISNVGTRLPLTLPYRVVKSVTLTLQDDGNGAEWVRVFDKDATSGPLVKAGAGATLLPAVVDAVVQGY